MKKFYLHNGTEQQGPFDIDDLRARIIKQDTPIWYEGISDWTTAGKIDELKDLFKTPPPFDNKQTIPQPINKTKTEQPKVIPTKKEKTTFEKFWTVLQVSVVLLIVMVIGVALFSKYSDKGGRGDSGSYQDKVMTVAEIEQANPARFLNASGTYNENFWGNAMKIHGTVVNKATVANYKDVIIEVICYSETETELSRDRYKIFDYFPAHSTKTFELKIDRPNACKKLGWSAVNATPY